MCAKIKRVPRKVPTYQIDMSKPVDVSLLIIPEADCFSREWSPMAAECRGCSDFDTCGVAFAYKIDKKVKKIEKAQEEAGATFLDLSDWAAIDKDEFNRVLSSRIESGKPCLYEKFLAAFMQQASSSDQRAGELNFDRFLFAHGYKKDNGNITK